MGAGTWTCWTSPPRRKSDAHSFLVLVLVHVTLSSSLELSANPEAPVIRRTVRYRPRAIVGATGLFPQTQPNRPAVPGQDEYQGEVLHTVDYHSGARFKGKKVLLVGFGNSANDVSAAALSPGLFKSLKEA